jgi:ABC-type transport system involved in multi-copper enzyme maturation permease subunit
MISNDLREEDADNYYIQLKANMKTIIDGNLYLSVKEKEILKGYTNDIKTPFIYEYFIGYEKFAYSTNAIGLFLMLGITYCLAPLFAGEYTTKMDALILSSRFGKNKLITAKILTGFSFSLLITVLGLVVSIVEIFCIYGIEGGNMPIQVWGLVGILMVYPFKCFTGLLLISLCLSFAAMLMSGIIMLLSAKLKSPYHTVILSSIIVLVPLIFQVPGDLRILNFLVHLLPTNMMSYDRIFSTYLYSVGDISITPYHFIPVFCMIAVCVLSIFTYRGFKKHQIA